MPYHVFGVSSGAAALISSSTRFARVRSFGDIAAIASRTAVSPSSFAFNSFTRALTAAFSSAVNPVFSAISHLRQPCQHLVDSCEAALRTFLDAVVHRRVALFGRREEHCLRQLRLLAEVFELERLQMVLESLHEPLGRIDLAELALDDTVRRLEAVAAAGTYVHLLDDRAVAPPFRDQLRIRPDGEDVRARRVEEALDPNLELARLGDHGGVHPVPFVRSTTWAKRSSRCSHVVIPSNAYGVSMQRRTRPTFSVVTSSASSS